MFPKIGVGFFHPKWMVKIMVPNPIKMDDLGVPLFLETPIYLYVLNKWLIYHNIIHLARATAKINRPQTQIKQTQQNKT